MRAAIRNCSLRFICDEEGVTLVEYGIAIVLALVISTTLIFGLAAQISANMDEGSSIMATRTAP